MKHENLIRYRISPLTQFSNPPEVGHSTTHKMGSRVNQEKGWTPRSDWGDGEMTHHAENLSSVHSPAATRCSPCEADASARPPRDEHD